MVSDACWNAHHLQASSFKSQTCFAMYKVDPSKGIMFNKLPNILRPLLHAHGKAFQESKVALPRTPVPRIFGVFTDTRRLSGENCNIGAWCSMVLSSASNEATLGCRVLKVSRCKVRRGAQDEFLWFEITSPCGEHTSILIVEKYIGGTCKGFSDFNPLETRCLPFSFSFSFSITPNGGCDVDYGALLITKNTKAYENLRRKLAKCHHMCTLTFSGEVKPSAHELAALLRVFWEDKTMYDVGNTQCHLFAGTMFDALKNLFPDAVQETHQHRGGKCNIVMVHTKDDVDQVCEKYHKARTAWAEKKRREEEKVEERQRVLHDLRETAKRERELCQAMKEAAKRERERRRAVEEENAKLRQQLEAVMKERGITS